MAGGDGAECPGVVDEAGGSVEPGGLGGGRPEAADPSQVRADLFLVAIGDHDAAHRAPALHLAPVRLPARGRSCRPGRNGGGRRSGPDGAYS